MAEEAINLIASNPILQNLVIGVASNAVYDVVKRIMSHLWQHFGSRSDVFKSEQVETIKTKVTRAFEGYDRGEWSSLDETFSTQFQQFLFPNRKIVMEKLDESQCNYVAERLFYGASFQSMLMDLGYTKENMKYMFAFPSKYADSPYYFDIKAKLQFPCVDKLLVARVVDNRAFDPIESLQAIPTRIKEINSMNPTARFRDFDLYITVHTGHYESSLNVRMKDILKTLQDAQSDYPRFVLFEKQELDHLIKLDKSDRVVSLKQKLTDFKIERRL